MAAIDFPDSPDLNEEFTAGTRTWRWNGVVWETVRSVSSGGGSGATGATGPMGPTGPGFTYVGEYYPTGSYSPNDVVSYNGSTYVALISNPTGAVPDTITGYWALWAEQGATGPQGPQGPQGPTGPAGSGGGGSLTIQQVGVSGATESYTEVTTLQFDEGAGFDVTQPTGGVARISMNSTFKYWQVNGVQKLTAEGLDTVNFVAGEGITIAADGSTSPQSITITSSAAAAAAGIHPFALIG